MVGESIRFTSIFFYNSKRLQRRLLLREDGNWELVGEAIIELACLLAANDEEES